jgi:glyoxylase-like metal-dependent hydrolase (beta-lactamase superfamily II)
MKGIFISMTVFELALCAIASPCSAQPTGIERLYVLECGHGTAPDQGRFAPGYNDGKPFDLSDNCYLIRHARGYFLWGTGIADRFAANTGGVPSYGGRPNWIVTKGLARQLEELRVSPSAIRYIGIANSHIDHIGNLGMFPAATLFIQGSEWEFAARRPFVEGMLDDARLKTDLPTLQIDGDHDVFGDGTVTIIATPSVTPGNQSLLVKLPKSGAILLSGDVVHFQYGWDHRIVPGNVWNKEKTLASFKRLSDIIAQSHAELWIEHDKVQSDARKFAPDYYE